MTEGERGRERGESKGEGGERVECPVSRACSCKIGAPLKTTYALRRGVRRERGKGGERERESWGRKHEGEGS